MSLMTYGRDEEVVQRLKPEPMTSLESEVQDKISDVDFEIFQHKMNMIAQDIIEKNKSMSMTNFTTGPALFNM